MARAGKLTNFLDPAEFTLSRSYLADTLSEVTKAKLVPHTNGSWLVNDINHTNYNTYLIAPPTHRLAWYDC